MPDLNPEYPSHPNLSSWRLVGPVIIFALLEDPCLDVAPRRCDGDVDVEVDVPEDVVVVLQPSASLSSSSLSAPYSFRWQ